MSYLAGLFTHSPSSSPYIIVGNGQSIPVISRGTFTLPIADASFSLNNVLVAPALVRNLLSVGQFTRFNSYSIEFDAFGFSIKDPSLGRVLLRCNSSGDLNTVSLASLSPIASCSLAVSIALWHHRLGHLTPSGVAHLQNLSAITCNKAARSLCHARHLGKHTRLPFAPQHLLHPNLLLYFIVTYGPPLSLAIQVTNIIWSC
jgi:hypothetical protein